MYLYEKIYHDLLQGIESGDYKNGRLLPTERELSEKYGVSRITAKKAFDMLVWEGLIVRIAGRGTMLAKTAKKEKSISQKLIGAIFCDIDSAFGEQVLLGMEAAAASLGCSIIFKRSFDVPENEDRLLVELMDLGVAGIIVHNCHGDYSKSLMRLYCDDFPVISIDRYTERLPIPCVASDHYGAARDGVAHLFQLGHKHILYLSSPVEGTSALADRLAGFRQAHIRQRRRMNPAGFILDIASHQARLPEVIAADVKRVRDALRENPDITALFASERYIASLAQQAAASLGKRIPEDYSLICFDHERTYDERPAITHMLQDQERIGATAVEKLAEMIEGRKPDVKTIFETTLVEGRSTAKV